MTAAADRIVEAFNQDVPTHGGYVYASGSRLSARMANERLTQATFEVADLTGKRVIDIGCGDGTYTVEIYDRGRPASIHAIDPAQAAVEAARAKSGSRRITYSVESAYRLPFAADSFDLAHVRGVLHHLEDPVAALREAFRVARQIVVIEPNGYSPALKLIERLSKYHRQHGEKSYWPHWLDRQVAAQGGRIVRRKWAGLVPCFCPDWLARAAKAVEPLVERIPWLNRVGCAVYVFSARRTAEDVKQCQAG